MFDLISDQPLRFIIALLIGLATAWWIWAHGRVAVGTGMAGHADFGDTTNPHTLADVPDAVALPIGKTVETVETAVRPDNLLASGMAAISGLPAIAQAVGPDDDLMMIKGIGPKLNELFHSLGIRRFDQIAAWTDTDVAKVDEHLESFRGRIVREEWVEQAKLLAAGKFDEFNERF